MYCKNVQLEKLGWDKSMSINGVKLLNGFADDTLLKKSL